MILNVEQIDTFYGASHVLFGVSLNVQAGEVVCILGRNGAGKTTTVRSIIGLTPIRSGRITFMGREISRTSPFKIARMGIGYVPEGRRIFPSLTVRQNLEVNQRIVRSECERSIKEIYGLFPALKQLETHLGGHLSGGEQEMLAIARAMIGNPSLLLMDEPTTGLSPVVVKVLREYVVGLAQEGVTTIMTEQNVKFGLEVAGRIYILDKGKVCYEGTSEQLKEHHEIKMKYLGV